jgi:hypothetical protein
MPSGGVFHVRWFVDADQAFLRVRGSRVDGLSGFRDVATDVGERIWLPWVNGRARPLFFGAGVGLDRDSEAGGWSFRIWKHSLAEFEKREEAPASVGVSDHFEDCKGERGRKR